MHTLFKKICYFFIFLLIVGVFSYSTFVSFLGAIFTLQSLSFLPAFTFEPQLIIWYGLGYISLIIFYLVLILYVRKRNFLLSNIFTVTKEKSLFTVVVTVFIVSACVILAAIKPEIFPLVNSKLVSFHLSFSLESFIRIAVSALIYLAIFYPFSVILFELIKPKKRSSFQSLVLIILVIFFNPIFTDFGMAFLAVSIQMYEFETTHIVCGVRVAKITPHTPAEKAGLRPDEIIEKVDDHQVTTLDDFSALIQANDLQSSLLVVTNKAAYQIVPIQDSKTGQKIIGIMMEPQYCEKELPHSPTVLESSEYLELTSFTDSEKMFTMEVPKNFNSYTETAYLTNSCTMFLDQPVEMEHGLSRVKGEGTFFQVCYADAEMPTTVPPEIIHSRDSQTKVKTQPFSINGYSGFRTQVLDAHSDPVEDSVFLKNPDGGYASLTRDVNGELAFGYMLKNFRFIKQTQKHFTTADQAWIRKYFSDQQKKNIIVTFNYPSLDETMVSGNVYLPHGQTCFSAKRSANGWEITQVGSDRHSQCD